MQRPQQNGQPPQPPQPPSGPSNYQPPTTPFIPPTIGQIIPRLRGAINDIDIFQNMVAQGAIDSSMPNWDALLRQYSLLTARLNALSTQLSTLHSSHRQQGPTSLSSSRNTIPLDNLFITPLNPLKGEEALAQGTYFEALNTMPLLPFQSYIETLTSPKNPRTMDESVLERMKDSLRDRLREEKQVGDELSGLVDQISSEYNWDTRVDEGDEDDLFGENEQEPEEEKEEQLPNPRAGWKLQDYIAYMDSGKRPIIL